ncbi:hypothetical protein [Paraburkholderia youngii]|uniref:Uncharacterized protein n=1 Tax=Paraburkholderia youngii TaxID=2782701 RepID=A0A7Y6MY17_9BURK|nr:hypothetical protein [Paraburkholderia youngii]NUX98833.1 hypothetical protein [Paraburkholderia youngii]
MINITDGELVFNLSGPKLNFAIRDALRRSSRAMLDAYNLGDVNLNGVTTKTNLPACYSMLVELSALKVKKFKFDETYVQNAFSLYITGKGKGKTTEKQFNDFTLCSGRGVLAYKSTYLRVFTTGVGVFLLCLHSNKAITLPTSFNWPFPRLVNGKSVEVGILVCSPMLHFVRELAPTSNKLSHPAFEPVGRDLKRRRYFQTCATKLLLATGWHNPSDGNLAELIEIKRAESKGRLHGSRKLPINLLVDVLKRRYEEQFAISVNDWEVQVASLSVSLARERAHGQVAYEDGDSLRDVLNGSPSMAKPAALRNRVESMASTPGLKRALEAWLDLEDVYIRKIKRESYKDIQSAMGYLNIYLFFYLPRWFANNPGNKLVFPSTPNLLIGGVFVSRLLVASENLPLTFVEVMNKIAEKRNWKGNPYYAKLKQVELFFSFIERNSDELPGCDGFKQALSSDDYPATSNSIGTDKQPMPRRLFGTFIDYIEAIRCHLLVIQTRILDGTLDAVVFNDDISSKGRVLDTIETSDSVGFVPILFVLARSGKESKTIPLRLIPNCLSFDWFELKIHKKIMLPQPHGLNNVLVSLYTGLRNNHIQWLDARTFDCRVVEEKQQFAKLHTNTDKTKTSAWEPHVNFRVIEILRSQKDWRNLIGWPGFSELIYYNNNERTKWPKILPLFSATPDGRPHSDSRYERTWRALLGGFQSIVPDLGEASNFQLCSLEPPYVEFLDAEADSKKKKYGAECDGSGVCVLDIKSKITPHSARVSVVSQFITFLPAEMIGTYVTGQTPATVHHYVKLDPEFLEIELVHQSMVLREKAYRNELEAFATAPRIPDRFIRADDVNSHLARSLRSNLDETLVSYGCVSIVLNEGSNSGLDVLRETRAAYAVENKTEICPYGNHCPPEVVKMWRGPHRCGLCQYAVRSVDHLPALGAKIKQFDEMLFALTEKIVAAMSSDNPQYSDAELDRLEEERLRIGEELAGWKVSEEVLYATKCRIAAGEDSRRWVVQAPEIILQDLQRVPVPSNATAYLLQRLQECIVYPTLESPQMRAKFDLLRRSLLARTGRMNDAFDSAAPVNPAEECAGLLRTMVEANTLTYEDLVKLLERDQHLTNFTPTNLLPESGGDNDEK